MNKEIILDALEVHHLAGEKSFLLVLAGKCPECKDRNDMEWCDRCDGTGSVLTPNGQKILELITPFIEHKMKDLKKELIRELKG